MKRLLPLVLAVSLAGPGLAQQSKDLQLKPTGPASTTLKGKRYALLVGVSKYGKGINPLRYTLNDVHAFKAALVDPRYGGFPADNVVALGDAKGMDGNPTLLEVGKKLKWLQIVTRPEDTVVIYFSGHGILDQNTSYLLTQDSDPSVPELSALSVTDFNKLVSAIPAKKKLIVLDACHSGGVSVAARGDGKMSDKMMESLHSQAEGEIRLLSCKTDQQSYEAEQLKRGVFSHFLVKGMTTSEADQNRDGWVTYGELEQYLQTQVPNWTGKNLTAAQNPVSEARVSGVFVISRVGKGNAPSPREDPVTVEEVATAAPPSEIRPTALPATVKPWCQGMPSWAPKKALELLPKAEAGDAEAQFLLYEESGNLVWDAGGALWAHAEHFGWLFKSAKQGHPRATVWAAHWVILDGPRADYPLGVSQALTFLTQRADQGDLDALHCLVDGFRLGGSGTYRNYPSDPARSRALLERSESLARQAGSREQLEWVSYDWVCAEDKQRARAVASTFPSDGAGLSVRASAEGDGSPSSVEYYSRAYQSYRSEGKLANACDVAMMISLLAPDDGSGTGKRRYRESLEAAVTNGGPPRFQYQLGMLLNAEPGQRSRALSLFEQAALQGHLDAQWELGKALIADSPAQALWWLEYAKTQTSESSLASQPYKEIDQLRARGVTPVPPVAKK